MHKTTYFFIAQTAAYWLMVIGFALFVVLWYIGQ